MKQSPHPFLDTSFTYIPMNNFYILDVSGFLFRSYYAIRQMTNEKGESTNALYGFTRSLLKILHDFQPEYLVAVFDGPKNTASRKAIFPAYKAHRKPAPADLPPQMQWAQELCHLMGIPMLSIEGVEADDTMATLALFGEKHHAQIYLCSSDKDLCSLVNHNIHILQTQKENEIWGPKEVETHFGVPPSQMIDYLAIIGDASDNVPGLPGFGPKTAVDLLKEWGSLEAILDHPEAFSGKKKETIIQGKEQALLSRRLIQLDTNISVPNDLSFYRIKSLPQEPLIAFYQEMNFKSLLKEIGNVTSSPIQEKYRLIDTEKELQELLQILSQAKEICIDTETTAINPLLAELVGIGFSIEEGEAYYVPCNGHLGIDRVLHALRPLFENPSLSFFGHNIKYDLHVLLNYDITIAHVSFDTLLASYILNAHHRQHSLDALSLERFGKTKIPIESLIGKGIKQISMRDVPIDQITTYCCEDADYTFRLKKVLENELNERNLMKILTSLELPLLFVLLEMERTGIYLKLPKLETMKDMVHLKLENLEQKIYAAAGETFNINSPKQLSELLLRLGVKLPKKTATGFSTSAEVLEEIQKEHPLIPFVLEYRILEKLRSTYIESLPQEINPRTHRIHSNFNQSIAATGRLSSQDPNLQNIPVRSDIGKQIRAAFCPEKEGFSFLSADYSQIELRLLAHLSNDPHLIEAFHQNEDIHRSTASRIFNIPVDLVTPDLRYQAKAVNFGVIYGQGAIGLSRNLKISRKEAAAFIDSYFKKYDHVRGFIESCVQKSQKTEKAVTMMGRERILPEIHSSNGMLRAEAERLAVNTPLQGSAADLIKMAMLEVNRMLKNEGFPSSMVLQIHDELLFELPDDAISHLTPLIRRAMEQIWQLKVPLIVDISIGKNWAEC